MPGSICIWRNNRNDLKKAPHIAVRRRAVANVPAVAGAGFEEIEYRERGLSARFSLDTVNSDPDISGVVVLKELTVYEIT